jgi:hypothetical protein
MWKATAATLNAMKGADEHHHREQDPAHARALFAVAVTMTATEHDTYLL